MNDEQVFELVRAELAKARSRYSWWPSDLVHAAAIASEENGEVIRAVNSYVWQQGDESIEDIRREAVQAIAMWCRFLTEMPQAEVQDVDPYTRARNLVIQQEAVHGR